MSIVLSAPVAASSRSLGEKQQNVEFSAFTANCSCVAAWNSRNDFEQAAASFMPFAEKQIQFTASSKFANGVTNDVAEAVYNCKLLLLPFLLEEVDELDLALL